MRLHFYVSILLLVPALAAAEVTLKNGGFTNTAQDLELKSAAGELQLRRTFNSFSPEPGWFGWGWGSLFETQVIVMPDGTAVVRENGTGRNTVYEPSASEPASDTTGVIVDAIAARDGLSEESKSALRETLQKNEVLRIRKVQQYGIRINKAPGTAWEGRSCGSLLRTAEGYKRTDCENTVDHFDAHGRLLRRNESEYSVRVKYDGERVASIEDSAGKRIVLKWTAEGRIGEAQAIGDRTAKYTYNEHGELVSMAGGNLERLDYTYDENHRLTSLGYIDTTSKQIRYNSDGMTASVTEREGQTSSYEYGTDPADSNRYWTKVIRTRDFGAPLTRTYEWRITPSDTGAREVAGISASDGRSRKDVVYDSKGRIVSRIHSGGYTESYVYHPRTGKMIIATKGTTSIHYRYNNNGDLSEAMSSDGDVFEFSYGDNGTISTVSERSGKRRTLRFKYNDMKKPVEIIVSGIGKISVDYDASGEITRVRSKGGAGIAMSVTQVFQNMLAMVSGTDSPMATCLK